MKQAEDIQSIYLKRMIKSELIDKGISDTRIVNAFYRIPRRYFVSEALSHRAYEAESLPIGFGQTISHPYTVAKMTALLDPREDEHIYEIGTGSGYQAAILSLLCAKVTTIERFSALSHKARLAADLLGLVNIQFLTGDGTQPPLDAEVKFDGIIITCAARHVPTRVIQMLKPGGRVIVPLGHGNHQELYRVIKEDEVRMEKIGPVRFVPLIDSL